MASKVFTADTYAYFNMRHLINLLCKLNILDTKRVWFHRHQNNVADKYGIYQEFFVVEILDEVQDT